MSGSFRSDAVLGTALGPDGTHRTRLTQNGVLDLRPRWSPDGTRLAFASGLDFSDNFDIYVMSTDGSGRTDITKSSADDDYPDWRPSVDGG